MRSKLIYHVILVVEALLIIIQLTTKHEAWIGMMCFWSVVVMENISDIIDEWGNRHGRT